jgi:hypothetical protein
MSDALATGLGLADESCEAVAERLGAFAIEAVVNFTGID